MNNVFNINSSDSTLVLFTHLLHIQTYIPKDQRPLQRTDINCGMIYCHRRVLQVPHCVPFIWARNCLQMPAPGCPRYPHQLESSTLTELWEGREEELLQVSRAILVTC